MWPKMLFELLPHFARLMPMADKYLSTRSASEKAQEAALAALALEVRGELGKGTDAQSGLLLRLQEQGTSIGELALDVTRTRIGVEGLELRVGKLDQTVEARIAKLEDAASSAKRLLVVLLALVVAALALLAVAVAMLFHR